MRINIFKQKDIISQKLLTFILKDCSVSKDGKLPSAAELSKRFGVSIVTMRELLKSMESMGILSLHHGRGIFLNHPETISDEMFETRLLIESHCARLAAEKITEDDINELRESLSLLKEASHKGNMDLYTEADFSFHLDIARIGRNRVLEKTLKNIRIFLLFQQRETNRILLTSREESYQEHQKIFDALVNKNLQEAETAMREHLQITKSLWKKSQKF